MDVTAMLGFVQMSDQFPEAMTGMQFCLVI